MNKLNIVILAAGKGTRMHSNKPKVLHQLAGKPLLQHVINCAKQLDPAKIIVVYGYGGEAVLHAFAHENITWVEQIEQLGTGHAVQQALPHLDENATTLILLGDVPLLSVESCKKLLDKTEELGLLTFIKPDPAGYGRIIRNSEGIVTAIIEHKDATAQQREIKEVNTGIIAAENRHLANWLKRLTNNNAQGEYYLTDIVAMAKLEDETAVREIADDESSSDGWIGLSKKRYTIATEISQDEASVTGVNCKKDLADLERVYQKRYADSLMLAGVTLLDPLRIDVRGELSVGKDVEIDVGCVFEGKVSIADNVKIGAYCVIKDAEIASGTIIAPFTHIDQAKIGNNSRIGPYARIRPGTTLAAETHIGNFVELKNAQVDIGSKINHLSYVGDSTVGKNVNIGAGTITCNYDGANKFRTIIEDDVFVGSDTQLIAPVTVGKGATIAAGSTITRDAPADQLTLCRAKEQKSIVGWKRPVKIKK
ncbi:MAG TPA: bifunctional UDP-N-acetylglucosamine diphosphorylase/glucosamine-1-phosphate N-acetyltransferase GlmU [Methylotenera sp.]|nr:bifunctional UDP-N-acetylglucosamine diphosphorylase/glucosamine-1-phosphate N-acetyltransferase GlmU [Methylotenera sp.]HPV45590.1 bifunctional UDP-N-acetylglucosamine diphosphorylase/glucosamine-1-phosphate N-acetyltransferase GlmU [Methylotenera sp.]